MASANKRTWQLQEFSAHDSNVNCLALGHKSGRVLATGGDDKKVNLWAVGQRGCIMSLTGHTTPIECVRFNHTEELVCAGSQTGAIKVYDLEACKIVKTLTGHRAEISCIDFHPYGDFLASGSSDLYLKLWDARRRGCICTFKSHKLKVNSIKFSPDGQWIASCGEDAVVKVWDLRAGRVLHEFTSHTNSVNCVEFHPHEFLLASGGLDRTVHFWDLENFQLVSSEKDLGAIKCLWFNPDGECLYTGVTDGLKVLGWEPARIYDSLPIGWGKVYDIATTHNQLVGASFHLQNVSIHIVDLKKVQPFGGPTPASPASPFSHGNSLRKSFSKEKPLGLRPKVAPDVNTIEESTSGTEPEEDVVSGVEKKDYKEVFKPIRTLQRTPPPQEPFRAPGEEPDPTQPQILSDAEDVLNIIPINRIELRNSPPQPLYSPPQVKRPIPQIPHISHSPPELLNSPPRSLTDQLEPTPQVITATPIARSQSNLDSVYRSRKLKLDSDNIDNNKNKTQIGSKYQLQRQYSCKDVPEKLPKNNDNGIKHSTSEININNIKSSNNTSTRKNSFSNNKTSRNYSNSNIPNVSRLPNPRSLIDKSNNDHQNTNSMKNDSHHTRNSNHTDVVNINSTHHYHNVVQKSSAEAENKPSLVKVPVDKPIGLDLEEFLPPSLRSTNYRKPVLSEEEQLENITRDHENSMQVLTSRVRALRLVYNYFKSGDTKQSVEKLVAMDDIFIFNDVIRSLIHRQSFWSLDICAITLPKIHELLQSKYEVQVTTSCECLRLIMRNFSGLIRTNMLAPCGYSVDIPREERYKKCKKAYDALMEIKSTLEARHNISGPIGGQFRQLLQDLEQMSAGI